MEYLSDGSWTKRLNAGWAAHVGVVASSLARTGFTGPASVFEGPLGLFRAYSGEPLPELLLNDLTGPLQIMQVGIKPYACCRYNHGLVDCMLDLKREQGIRSEDVEAIRLGVLSGGWALVADPIEVKRAPRTVVDAQFSAPFAVALALARGGAGPDLYNEETLSDPTLRHLMARMECYRDSSLDSAFPRLWPSAVEVTLRDGRRLATRSEFTTGDPEKPLSRADLVAKFVSLASGLMSSGDAEALAQRILHLDKEPTVRMVAAALRG
jgi:2-methylcitrate dehydratase PrpD